MFVVGVGNYLFNILIGRKLGPINYGVFVSLNSLLALAGVVGGTLMTSATKFTSEFKAKNQSDKIGKLIKYLNNKGSLFGIVITLSIILTSKLISNFLNIGSNIPVIILSLIFLFSFALSINRGILQGLQNFVSFSINMAIEPVLKIILAIMLIWMGLKVNGVFVAIIIATTIVYLLSLLPIKKFLVKTSESIDSKMIWRYSFNILIASILLSVLTFLDVVLVKHYFEPNQAGIYSAISTIAKIILYISTPIISVMFPMVSDLHARNEKHSLILGQTLIIVSIMSSLILSFFVIYPAIAIKILFGSKYLSAVNYLGSLSLAFFLLTLSYIFIYYYLSIKKTGFIYLLFSSTVLEIVLMYIYHGNLNQIINNLMISFGCLLFGLVLMYIILKRGQIVYAVNNYSHQ